MMLSQGPENEKEREKEGKTDKTPVATDDFTTVAPPQSYSKDKPNSTSEAQKDTVEGQVEESEQSKDIKTVVVVQQDLNDINVGIDFGVNDLQPDGTTEGSPHVSGGDDEEDDVESGDEQSSQEADDGEEQDEDGNDKKNTTQESSSNDRKRRKSKSKKLKASSVETMVAKYKTSATSSEAADIGVTSFGVNAFLNQENLKMLAGVKAARKRKEARKAEGNTETNALKRKQGESLGGSLQDIVYLLIQNFKLLVIPNSLQCIMFLSSRTRVVHICVYIWYGRYI